MKKSEVLKQITINKLSDDTVFIQNKLFNFAFTLADSVCREDLKGQYRYFGGLQSDYDSDSPEYKQLEKWLCEIAENVLDVCATTPAKVQLDNRMESIARELDSAIEKLREINNDDNQLVFDHVEYACKLVESLR